jgi:predicted nucleic-acid-binding protein
MQKTKYVGIDITILINYLSNRDTIAFSKATLILEKSQNTHFFVNNIVICELATYLENEHGYSTSDVSKLLKELFSIEILEFENRLLLWQSILLYEQTGVEFSDCMVSVLNSNLFNCTENISLNAELKSLFKVI